MSAEPDSISTLIDDLQLGDDPQQSAALIEQALATVLEENAALARDRAISHVLADQHGDDGILPHLQLATLGQLLERCTQRLVAAADPPPADLRDDGWRLLDLVRRSPILRRITTENLVAEWTDRITALIDASHYTFGAMLRQRCETYGGRPLLQLNGHPPQSISWRQVGGRVDLIARGLLAVSQATASAPVAILSENRLEMALVDLACLANGIVNVVIPASASELDVAFILRHSGAGTVIVSDGEQLRKVLSARNDLPELQTLIAFEHEAARTRDVLPFEAILEQAGKVSPAQLAEHRDSVRIDDLATIMYTSGTTGTPKGIMFSHRNLVSKRFARAIALPEIGEEDRFLCYLPLFHTFGRFLELCGCIFWGATYCFAESPAISTIIQQMQELRPTVFISIPMKWMQLYEQICRQVDIEIDSDQAILAATRKVTGGQLRWGLSAAGYLDPEIFRFFQRQGVELMSGFGMTEATGGITMTPPGQYRPGSLGKALPGIELALAEDGELKIRGPYVMTGYLNLPDGEGSFDEEGWFPTGDLMEADEDGFLSIVDRKKEIYKNAKGETIAPQKIENLFRDFESVGRVFLVGDHRPCNTALIYPNPDFTEIDLTAMSAGERRSHFASLVVSANAFLAPYERIVDFALIDRDFDQARRELTAKGTFRRRTIEESFASTIALLYRRTTVTVGGLEVDFPNWLFQVLGITTQDLSVVGDQLRLASISTALTLRLVEPGTARIGSAFYRIEKERLDVGMLLTTPRLWIGNAELVAFAPLSPEQRRRRRVTAGIEWSRSLLSAEPAESDREAARALLHRQSVDLLELHQLALLLSAPEANDGVLAVRVLDHLLGFCEGEPRETILHLLRRIAGSDQEEVVRRAFQVLLPVEHQQRLAGTVESFLDGDLQVLDTETIAVLVERDLQPECLTALCDATERYCSAPWPLTRKVIDTACSLLQLLAEYGAAHPTRYRRLRAVLTTVAMIDLDDEVGAEVARAREHLQLGFRRWVGEPSRIAVDPETGLEYRWDDVIAFADEVDDEGRRRLLGAIKSTSLLREGVFLFSGGSGLRLEDILPGGIWIRLLGEDHGKSVYRVAVRTRSSEQYDLAVNLNRTMSADEVTQEIDWLIICSETGLVETFGGYWPEYDLWTEEYIHGETLDHALRRLGRHQPDQERLQVLWPFVAWSAMSAFVALWHRTGEANPSPGNVTVPLHDYHSGARLVSISGRRPLAAVTDLLLSLHDDFIRPVEESHSDLAGLVGWQTICSAYLETVGQERGLRALRAGVELLAGTDSSELISAIESFVEQVEQHGFVPCRLHFAADRYRRWAKLNPEATLQARARTLQEMEVTYDLNELQPTYPEVRARFFRETVFAESEPALTEALDQLVHQLRSGATAADDLSAAISDLRAQLRLSPEDDFFLARLSYPHLQPEDVAVFVAAETGGARQSEMVVTMEDADGNLMRIRHALSAKEVARLHRLFISEKLPVQLRPEHRFLVAINERDLIIGGLYYELLADEQAAHLDKIVVAGPFRGKGVAGALLEELCNRLRTAGIQSLTTGFFRPQFFYRYGFTVERRYAGLVRSLVQPNGNGAEAQEQPITYSR
jgi:long-subunit acyl-CoA synthetase (AMP-forming)/GNAT superfamily N-acetyltransferase